MGQFWDSAVVTWRDLKLRCSPIWYGLELESAVSDCASFVLAELFFAYSSGVRSPRELCGRSVLYSIRQFSIARRAWAIVRNQCSFRHSSRNLPLKLSTYAFSTGLPGRMKLRL